MRRRACQRAHGAIHAGFSRSSSSAAWRRHLRVAAQAARGDDRAQIGQRVGELVVDDDVVEIAGMRDFLARFGEAARDRRRVVRRARAQTPFQLLARRRQDEDADAIRAARLRTCRAPCQSISSSTSRPCASSGSTAARDVP